MKKIFLFAALLMPFLAFAQYPNFPSKMTLGLQTTGDGLIYRGAGAPAYTPTNNRNAWVYLDTVASELYVFTGGIWQTTGGGENIYNASDTISGDRTVTQDTFFLSFQGVPTSGAPGLTRLLIDPSIDTAGNIQLFTQNSSFENSGI